MGQNKRKAVSFKAVAQRLADRLVVYRQGDRKNVLLIATRRGGSTLLAEMVSVNRGVWMIDQPFHLFQPHLLTTQIKRRYLPDKPSSQFIDLTADEEPRVRDYIEALMTARIRGLGWIRRPKFPCRADRSILKILNATPLIDWFGQQIDAHLVYLARHPAAQTLSVIRNEWEASADVYLDNTSFVTRYLNDQQVELGKKILSEGSRWQQGILNWVMENIAAIRSNHPGLVRVHYEDFITDPQRMIDHIGDALQLDDRRQMHEQIKRPSGSSNLSTESAREAMARQDRSFLVANWQKHVDDQQLEQGQAILDAFEIDLYTMGDPQPSKRLQPV